jgi:hypothetical protein
MSFETYPVEKYDRCQKFYFVSQNADGENRVIKIISYDKVVKSSGTYYNLGFGDLDQRTRLVDDKAISNNNDMRKILATVVSTLPDFFKVNPSAKVHIDGSTHLRTKYYHKLIRDYSVEINDSYKVAGFREGVEEEFDPQREYEFI